MVISMDIYGYIHIHRRLTCVHTAPNFCKIQQCNSVYFPVKHDTDIPHFKLLEINKIKNKRTLHYYSLVLSKFREHLHNFIARFWGTICRVSVVSLSVTHVLWLNGTSLGVGDGIIG